MAIEFIKQCHKEVLYWPDEVREDFADAIARLERGHMLSMPISRPMPSIGKGVQTSIQKPFGYLPSNLLYSRK